MQDSDGSILHYKDLNYAGDGHVFIQNFVLNKGNYRPGKSSKKNLFLCMIRMGLFSIIKTQFMQEMGVFFSKILYSI